MDCVRCVELMIESLDVPLAEGDRRDLEAHLSRCPGCAETLRTHVALRTAVRELGPAEERTPALPERLVSRYVAAMGTARTEGGTSTSSGGSARTA